MGIPGLLPLLKDVTHHVHIGEYRGKVAGIDAFCWLHRGAFTCCTELVLGRPTDKCVACGRRRRGALCRPRPPLSPLMFLIPTHKPPPSQHRYINFCMERVRLLQAHGVTPLVVFDGASIPSKRARNVERRE